jgi:hypothetical protein
MVAKGSAGRRAARMHCYAQVLESRQKRDTDDLGHGGGAT